MSGLTKDRITFVAWTLSLTVLFILALRVIGTSLFAKAHAQETQEVRPYVFAELPHGRIYKAVHEGCELFITESDFGAQSYYKYPIATGRGCK